MLGLIGSVTRTRVLCCQILFNSCWAGDWQSDCCTECCLFFSKNSGCACFTSLLGSVFYTWTLLQLQGCQLWFLFFCVCLIGFSCLIQCFITDQCFITVLSRPLDNCLTTFFLLTVDPWGLQGVKKKKPWNAAHNLRLSDPARLVPAPFIYRSVSVRLCTVRKSFWS